MKLPSLQLETLKVFPIQYRAGFCYKNDVAKVHLIVNENDLAILMFVHRYYFVLIGSLVSPPLQDCHTRFLKGLDFKFVYSKDIACIQPYIQPIVIKYTNYSGV